MNKKPYLPPDMEVWQTEPIHLLKVSQPEEERNMDYNGSGEDNDDGEGSTGDTF